MFIGPVYIPFFSSSQPSTDGHGDLIVAAIILCVVVFNYFIVPMIQEASKRAKEITQGHD